MDKNDLIAALRDTGIVNVEKDGNGIRVLLTLNDLETLKEKKDRDIKQQRLIAIQSVGIIVTALILISTTFFNFSSSVEKYIYFSQRGYILRINKETAERCIIVNSSHENVIYVHKETTGLSLCSAEINDNK